MVIGCMIINIQKHQYTHVNENNPPFLLEILIVKECRVSHVKSIIQHISIIDFFIKCIVHKVRQDYRLLSFQDYMFLVQNCGIDFLFQWCSNLNFLFNLIYYIFPNQKYFRAHNLLLDLSSLILQNLEEIFGILSHLSCVGFTKQNRCILKSLIQILGFKFQMKFILQLLDRVTALYMVSLQSHLHKNSC